MQSSVHLSLDTVEPNRVIAEYVKIFLNGKMSKTYQAEISTASIEHVNIVHCTSFDDIQLEIDDLHSVSIYMLRLSPDSRFMVSKSPNMFGYRSPIMSEQVTVSIIKNNIQRLVILRTRQADNELLSDLTLISIGE